MKFGEFRFAPMLRIGFVLALGWATIAMAAPPRLHAGDVAPDIVGHDREGQPVTISSYGGRVVVLSFWASWCGPCRKELPILEGIQRTAKDRVQVLAINIESEDVYRKIAPQMASLAITVASDSGKQSQAEYGVNGIPHMVIIGKDGRILRVHRGYSDAGVDEAIDDLNKALAK